MKQYVAPELKVLQEKNKKQYSAILKAIKRYDRIAIFRHIIPDYDALGTQMGLYYFLKENFPNKEIIVLGDNHVSFTPRLFPEMDKPSDDWFLKPFLGIVVDVNGKKRIADPRIKKAKYKIVIDHHPLDENHLKSKVLIDETGYSACAEIVADILLYYERKYGLVIPTKSAENLYIGIVGDSGRFMYSSTNIHTFVIAEELFKKQLTISKIYQNMYEKEINDLRVTAYILNHFTVSPKGVAYYVLSQQTLDELNIPSQKGKDNVNLFSNIHGINAWCSITEDVTEPCYRISIRSKEKDISGVARNWGGGGHAQASGARIDDLSQLEAFIKDLDKLF